MQICYQPGKIEISFYQPVSIWITICQLVYPTSWQICTSWNVSNHQQHPLIFVLNGWNFVEQSHLLKNAGLILWSNYFVDIALTADKFQQWNVPAGKREKLNLAASWKILHIGYFFHRGSCKLLNLNQIGPTQYIIIHLAYNLDFYQIKELQVEWY